MSNREYEIYEDEAAKVYRKKFDIEDTDVSDVALWNLSPVWPGKEKADLNEWDLHVLIRAIHRRSSEYGHMVLWMPAASLHNSPFDPVSMCGPWTPVSTVISGSYPIHVGYVYSRAYAGYSASDKTDRYWGTKLLLDEKGSRGASSSLAMKFLLKRLRIGSGLIVEPFAHRSATLALWARRLGHEYVGYTASKKAYGEIAKRLAQAELPGIQLDLPA